LAAEVGFPAGAINVVPGDGPTTGAYLVKHPGVDKVAFTGSTKTGGEIMRLCSEPIKRLTLELGGKRPHLVFGHGDPPAPETQMGSLISQAHQERVPGFVESARGEGAEVVLGGEPGEHAFYSPTGVAGVGHSRTIAP